MVCGTILPKMTPEERFERIERQLELTVSQQGQFYADLHRLTEQVGLQQKQIETQQGQIGQVVDIVGRMGDMLDQVMRAQERTENHLLETDQRLRETDQRLNILISVAERHISGNGPGAT